MVNINIKKITFLVPCYNEEQNIEPMVEALRDVMKPLSDRYDYEIIYRDNVSTDGSLKVLKELAAEDKRIKVIVNARNYGNDYRKNSFRGRVSGDVIIMIAGDLQEPPELIPEFIKWYEKGYEAVCGQKTDSEEGWLKYHLRQLFYNIIDTFSDTEQFRNMSGIILMSRRLMDLLWESNSYPAVRYFLSDLGCEVKLIPYKQRKRTYGKSSYSLGSSLTFAISALLETSVKPLRMATLLGLFMSVISFLLGLVYLIMKLLFWYKFNTGTAPLLIAVFFIGSVLLFFLGIVGEYVGNILGRLKPHNPPIVRELINFDGDDPYLIRHVDEDLMDAEE